MAVEIGSDPPLPAVTRCGRSAAAARPAIIRYAGRHLGFLAGLLIVAVAFGVTYRYLVDPLAERTVPFYIRSCIHAMGLTFVGWAVHLTFAAVPRSRLGVVQRRLPLSAEFIIKALTMTAALTSRRAPIRAVPISLVPALAGR